MGRMKGLCAKLGEVEVPTHSFIGKNSNVRTSAGKSQERKRLYTKLIIEQ